MIPSVTLPPVAATALQNTPRAREAASSAAESPIRTAARAFESVFLAEMLSQAGLGQAREGLGGGGVGEQAFASLLSREWAESMAARGGIGLAEHIERAMAAREGYDV